VSESAATRELALFPLNTVLFPGGPLPLRIFETRYLDMVRACMREGRGFGVVLLERGPEAGGTAQFVEVGTEASIVDFTRLEDGLLGITCIGRGRFRVLEAWRQDDGELYAPVPRRFEDAAWVGHRLAEMLPLATPEKQSLLEMCDPLARLAVIAPLIKRPD